MTRRRPSSFSCIPKTLLSTALQDPAPTFELPEIWQFVVISGIISLDLSSILVLTVSSSNWNGSFWPQRWWGGSLPLSIRAQTCSEPKSLGVTETKHAWEITKCHCLLLKKLTQLASLKYLMLSQDLRWHVRMFPISFPGSGTARFRQSLQKWPPESGSSDRCCRQRACCSCHPGRQVAWDWSKWRGMVRVSKLPNVLGGWFHQRRSYNKTIAGVGMLYDCAGDSACYFLPGRPASLCWFRPAGRLGVCMSYVRPAGRLD